MIHFYLEIIKNPGVYPSSVHSLCPPLFFLFLLQFSIKPICKLLVVLVVVVLQLVLFQGATLSWVESIGKEILAYN